MSLYIDFLPGLCGTYLFMMWVIVVATVGPFIILIYALRVVLTGCRLLIVDVTLVFHRFWFFYILLIHYSTGSTFKLAYHTEPSRAKWCTRSEHIQLHSCIDQIPVEPDHECRRSPRPYVNVRLGRRSQQIIGPKSETMASTMASTICCMYMYT